MKYIASLLFGISLVFSTSANADFYDKDCENLLSPSFMFQKQNCSYSDVSAAILWTEERICSLTIDCKYPQWHPKSGEKVPTRPTINILTKNISKMRWCVDGSFDALGYGDWGDCTPLTLRDYTNSYRKAMLEHAWWAKSLFPGKCSHLDPDADTHWCRWDTVTRLISAASVPGSGYTYRDAYKYAKNIADTRGWENWKKMVRLIEGL